MKLSSSRAVTIGDAILLPEAFVSARNLGISLSSSSFQTASWSPLSSSFHATRWPPRGL
ncbi:hypothetical protein CIHG_05737 [Coccidioides immitis H538.4]|uniref:Uncharacterized protein n=3 Tax=Coccidioides immitis TaxID=5501 RepID=A0A0J8R267_COCIT|nr:hypothetical protein CIRG_08519 [Coccidioides immitis RMSCC 2394]KMU78836.1 hypothetical protein CISG_01876 [Coccidioides immitis RMSCC 3703]KMU87970.1 hypothetical protein CIHG_05737 [Coccidioides immitis H538.4]